jgi:hypothetical protein
MGMYINPPDMSKEEWLVRHCAATHSFQAFPPPSTTTHLPVCWVNNGAFTAAAVGYSPKEVEVFSNPDDPRPKLWFSVPRADLRTLGLEV